MSRVPRTEVPLWLQFFFLLPFSFGLPLLTK
jgi:hypothetical protein